MSSLQPLFRPLEDFKPGMHCGLFYNLHKTSNRRKVVREAERALGGHTLHARRVAFITWLCELGYITDNPGDALPRVQQSRPHDRSAYWTLREGIVELECDDTGRWWKLLSGGPGFRQIYG